MYNDMYILIHIYIYYNITDTFFVAVILQFSFLVGISKARRRGHKGQSRPMGGTLGCWGILPTVAVGNAYIYIYIHYIYTYIHTYIYIYIDIYIYMHIHMGVS